MITPQELRIGNWVNYSGRYNKRGEVYEGLKGPFAVTGMREHIYLKNLLSGLPFSFSFGEIEPIPLTPEILEKCGFNKKTYGGAGLFYVNGLVHISEYLNYLNCDPYGSVENSVSVQYLHQLQNLFYVLTGQELEIKL